jgi:excisionase family DNA binding protein
MKYKSSDVLTTGQVAKICNVAPRTVSKWFDAGELPGYRIPGSRDRRIPFNRLIQFMESNGLPMDGIADTDLCIVVQDDDRSYLQMLASAIHDVDDRVQFHASRDDFLTGILLERHRPDALLVHAAGRADYGESLASVIRTEPQHRKMFLIAMMSQNDEFAEARLLQAGFDHCMPRISDVFSLLALLKHRLTAGDTFEESA